MRIVFCIYDFVDAKLPLQPWLSMSKLATALASKGHSVSMLTDVADPARIEGATSYSVTSLRGSNGPEVRKALSRLNPEALVFLPTPLNIATASWLDGLDCRRIGFASFSYYNAVELGIAMRRLPWREVRQYARHLLVPGPLWKRAMRRRLQALVTQSETTADRLGTLLGGNPPALCIPPGIDLSAWPPRRDPMPAAKQNSIRLLYLGAATRIRGFEIALDAMNRVTHPGVRLRILARGANAQTTASIESELTRRGLEQRISLEGGWIERDKLVAEIHAADAVLQPFVLVPSELPVTAMEVIACGTPVIGSRIDGLPSTIGPAGTVAAQGDARNLATAIDQFATDAEMHSRWRVGCLRQRAAMLSWDAVASRWEDVLHG